MKTTLDLPDELMRAIKLRAVREDRKLKDLIAQLLRQGLEVGSQQAVVPGRRVQLPLVRTARSANPEEEMTPDRVFEMLTEEDSREANSR